MLPDPILSINRYFEGLYPSAIEEAQQLAIESINEMKLEELPIEQQVLKLQEKLSSHKKEMESMEGREYAHDIASEAVTRQLFLARMLFSNIKDEALIRQAFISKEKYCLLQEVFRKKLAQLPPSTFAGFLSRDQNALIYDLKEKTDIKALTQYLAIKNWQTQRMTACIDLESSKMIERFIAVSGSSWENTEGITSEIRQITYLFNNARVLKASSFIMEISRLKAFCPTWLPEDKDKIHHSFCQYLEGNFNQPSFNAPFLNSNFDKITNNQLSDAPICCWSLIKYKKRLERSLELSADLSIDLATSCDFLFVSTLLNELYHHKEQLVFKKKYREKSLPVDEYKKIILEEMEKCRLTYNKLVHPEYYHLLLEAPGIMNYKLKPGSYEHPDFVKFNIATAAFKNYFVNDCFRSINCDNELLTDELIQVIRLHKMMIFLMKELSLIDEGYYDAQKDEMIMNCRNYELIVSMVPSKAILEKLMDAGSASIAHALARVPIYIISENMKQSLKEAYRMAEDHLEKFFKTQTIDHKRCYITEQMKDLKYSLKNIKPQEQLLLDHLLEFQKLLKIEMKGIKTQLAYQQFEISHMHHEPEQGGNTYDVKQNNKGAINDKNSERQTLTFCYNNTRNDNLPLMCKELKKLKAIHATVTLPQMRKLFNGVEVTEPIKWIASQGDLMVFIKEAIKGLDFPYQQQWHIAVKCFIREDGTAFNSQSLKSAKPTDKARKFIKAGDI